MITSEKIELIFDLLPIQTCVVSDADVRVLGEICIEEKVGEEVVGLNFAVCINCT